MGVLVHSAIACLAGSLGAILGATVVGVNWAGPLGLLFGIIGFFVAQQLVPQEQAVVDDYEEKQARKEQRKKREQDKKKREREDALREAEEAAAEKAAEKAAKKKKKELAKKKASAVESDSESEEEEAVDVSKLSKSAAKKLKAAAKAKADAKADKSAAEKKKEKEKAKAKAKAEAERIAKAEAKLRAQLAADTEGWSTIETTKPAKKVVEQQPAHNKKVAEVPSSERLLTIEVIIPSKHHGMIMGAQGATLTQLQTGTGATIDIPKKESGSNKITITGTPAQVGVAKNAIESLVERGFSAITHPGKLSDDLTIDPNNIGVLFSTVPGTKDSVLKTIQEKTKTRVNLPEKGTAAKTAKIVIVGDKDGVRTAKGAIKQLLADGYSTLTHENYQKIEIVFPKEKLGFLIGPKGETIKNIQRDTETRINIPDKNSNSNHVSVVGLPLGIQKAEARILKLLEPPPAAPAPVDQDMSTAEAWGQHHTAQGEDALW